jgi:hypothetical protein
MTAAVHAGASLDMRFNYTGTGLQLDIVGVLREKLSPPVPT